MHQEVLLHLLHAAHHLEAVLRFDELDEAEALALDDLALAPGDQPVDLVARRARRVRRRPSGRRRSGASSLRDFVADMPAVRAASFWARAGASVAAPEDSRR